MKSKRNKPCTTMGDYYHGAALGHVLWLCPAFPHTAPFIGDSSGSMKQLCFWSHFVFSHPGCLAPNIGDGFVHHI